MRAVAIDGSKPQASMQLTEGFLSDLKAQVHAVRDAGFSRVRNQGWQRAEEGLERA